MDESDPLFNLVSARYDSAEEIEKYKGRAHSGLLDWEKTVRERYFRKTDRVLDIGCGCGREALALAGHGHSVTGIDISARQIAIARDMARAAGCTIDFRLTDGRKLAFPSGSFEHVLIWSQVLGNVPSRGNRLSLLKEAFRVLEPRGTLSLSVHNRAVCEPIAIRKGLVQPSPGWELEDGDFLLAGDSPSKGNCYWHYFSKQELTEMICLAGFDVLECDVAPAFGQTGPDPRQLGWDTLWIAVAGKTG